MYGFGVDFMLEWNRNRSGNQPPPPYQSIARGDLQRVFDVRSLGGVYASTIESLLYRSGSGDIAVFIGDSNEHEMRYKLFLKVILCCVHDMISVLVLL